MGDAVAKGSGKNTQRCTADGKLLCIGIATDRVAVFIDGSNPPVVIAGIDAGIFIITADGAIHNERPDSAR